ncbi:helix-turn-helix domain-containing protein, partial [Streptomyces scabiei]
MSGRELWTDAQLRAAWARQDWAAILREYRRAAGLSQRQLEPLVGMPQPHISAIESGRRR